jgi:nicotinate phosphoribosyltransferase
MAIFDHTRLTQTELDLDIRGLRRGLYSDKYFENVARVLAGAVASNYTFSGHSPRILSVDPTGITIGDLEVEAQIFNRRSPMALVAGVDVALVMLRHATGFVKNEQFIETWQHLRVEAVEDGELTHFAGDTEDVQPVIRIFGRYRDFTQLETPVLGVLTRASRIATNVYNVLKAARGKAVLFFPARFDLVEVQPTDGYAYWLAVQRYNRDENKQVSPLVSTDAQAKWWRGRGGGTVPHGLIACFMADTAEAMVAFAEHTPIEVPRVALVDFNNDCVADSLKTLAAYWQHYQPALASGDTETQKRWTLLGVRLDTSGNMHDASVPPDGEGGVSPVLVRAVRSALDRAWEGWNVPGQWQDAARNYCRNVQIVVSGGFNAERIERFERENVPVDVYGVGSTFLRNAEDSNTDFTMDVVRIKIRDTWLDMAKIGRKPNENPDLQPVDLSAL